MTTELQKKPRRKFKFKDRAAAEAAHEEMYRDRERNCVIVHALVRDEVRWVDGLWGADDCWYRFGYVWARGFCTFVIVFECHGTGQKPSVTVAGEEWVNEVIASFRVLVGGKLESEYRDGLIKVRCEAMANIA